MDLIEANAACIAREIAWFQEVLQLRLQSRFAEEPAGLILEEIDPPELPIGPIPYASVVREFEMGPAERLLLILAFLPHVRPDALDPFLLQNEAVGRRFTEFGGVLGSRHSGFLPTAETALFLLAGGDTYQRLAFLPLVRPDCYLYRLNILRLDGERSDDPPLTSALQVTREYLELLTTGHRPLPQFSSEFPARRLMTTYEWEDLVLDQETWREIEDIVNWIRHKHVLLSDWQLERRIKPGYRTLFYGPPGTGKSLTAALLGKYTGKPVFRIDISAVLSKYIGETEKNLANLFDRAESQDWILFFDGADALFGKRTETSSSNDRPASQQVSYLLQRIEEYSGIVILATNLLSNADDVFSRQFQSIVRFSMPSYDERLRLWEDNFRDKPYRLAAEVSLQALARDYEFAGGSIVNVLRYACLQAVARNSQEIQASDLLAAVRRELHKEGKFLDMSRKE